MLEELIETLPRERGATTVAPNEPRVVPLGPGPGATPYSISGQSEGNQDRADAVALVKLVRKWSGIFSNEKWPPAALQGPVALSRYCCSTVAEFGPKISDDPLVVFTGVLVMKNTGSHRFCPTPGRSERTVML
jgi:hypothetical protein